MKVIKGDGTQKELKAEKIIKVVMAAGLNQEQAKTLADKVIEWVNQNHKEKVSSLKIRDRVIIELQKIDKYAADIYIWYQSRKDKST